MKILLILEILTKEKNASKLQLNVIRMKVLVLSIIMLYATFPGPLQLFNHKIFGGLYIAHWHPVRPVNRDEHFTLQQPAGHPAAHPNAHLVGLVKTGPPGVRGQSQGW